MVFLSISFVDGINFRESRFDFCQSIAIGKCGREDCLLSALAIKGNMAELTKSFFKSALIIG
jgi:hypothetical protein